MTLHLHIGAHKTATTHLQATLIKHQALLAAASVQFEPPDAVRSLIGAGRRAAARMGAFPSLRRAGAMRRLARMDTGCDRMLVSDENSLGQCAEIFEQTEIYPTALPRLKIWRRLARKRETIVYLGIRDYAGFLSGAYVQSIRKGAVLSPDGASRAALCLLRRRWTDVVADVRRALPGARLRVWAFEDHETLAPRLLQEMTGQTLSPVRRRPMATPSRDAVNTFLSARKHGAADLLRFERDHPISADNPKFTLWSKTESAALFEAYQTDLAALRRDLGEDFLSP